MPIGDYAKIGVNPFTKQKIDILSLGAFCPKPQGLPRLVLEPRKPRRGEDAARVTRYGGAPLLDGKTRWPKGRRGPLTFVGQLDFAQLQKAHRGGLALPREGILSVFYDVERQPCGLEVGDERSFATIYTPDPETAELREDDDEEDPIPLRVLDAAFEKKPASDAGHHVGGDPDWIQSDERPFLQLAAAKLPMKLAGLEAAEAKGVDVVGTLKRSKEWRLLWQIDSDDVLFTWGDAGRLYVFIREADLKAGRFDQARHLLQCF